MMKNLFVCLLGGLLLATPAVAEEETKEREMPVRNFDRFEFDTGTQPGFRFEVATILDTQSGLRALDTTNFEDRNGNDVDMTTIETRVSLGGDKLEVGAIFPYHLVDDIESTRDGGVRDQQDIGDIRAYMKIVPIRTDYVDIGAGYDISFDSGDPADGMGATEIGHLPFATALFHLGPLHAGGHIGYRFFNHSENSLVPESLVWGGNAHVVAMNRVAARVEITGQVFDVPGENFDSLAVQPGLDFFIPCEEWTIMLRPHGSLGLNNHTSDWGAGGSVVITRDYPVASAF